MRSTEQSHVHILNCLPSSETQNDWSPANARDAGILAAAPPVPPNKDLREAWWKVGDQKTTGSCVGWATADGVLRWHFVKLGRIAKNERLSVRFAWMAAKETDEFVGRPSTFIEMDGTSLKAALDVARKFGAVRESILPFQAASLCCDLDANSFYALASQMKISSYFNLGKDLHAWREWLAFKGPILARLEVDDNWQEATRTQGRLQTYLAQNKHGGHAVALVGYTPDSFIVRNSWSTDWGDCGFAYASLSYVEAAFTETYGVNII